MSVSPQMIQQMLMQGLSQPAPQSSMGGGQAGPAMQGSISPGNAAATLAQKVMLMKALQGRAAQTQANGMMPATNAQIAQDPSMLALQQPVPMQPPPQVQPQVQPPQQPPVPSQ